MKRTIIIILAYLLGISVNAEDSYSEKLPSDRNHWTVTVGYDASIPGNWKEGKGSSKRFRAGSGINIGADYMWLLGNNFFFEPGARIFIDNYSYHNVTIGAGTPSEPSKTYDPPVRKTGIRIPLTAGYKLDIFKKGSLLLSTGPEPIIGFTARTEVDKDQKNIFEENLYKKQMRRFDVAWDFRAAIIIDRFHVDLTGAIGMIDVIKTDAQMHEYRISIGLGYIF